MTPTAASAAEEPRGPHRLHVVQGNVGGMFRARLDGIDILASEIHIDFKAGHLPLAQITLPVIVENLEAITALDIDLANPYGTAIDDR